MKRTRLILASDIHYCACEWYGATRDEQLGCLVRDLENEYKNDPYEALLLLGDYSLDHWAWNVKGCYIEKGISDTKSFVDTYLDRLAPEGVAVRMIAGNHEQYGEELWERLTGHKRRDHLVVGDILFILTDTFGADLDPTEHSDGTYIGSSVEDIKALMAHYPDKKVIICAHSMSVADESEEFKALLRDEKRILCLFGGHNHTSRVERLGEELGGKSVLYTGHYSYSGEKDPTRCLRGYRELVITDKGISSKYIVPTNTYVMSGVRFTTEYAEQDEFELEF